MSDIGVLIVDDDFRVAAIHSAYVDRVEGFVVVGKAHTAADATRLITNLAPDLVLMDIYLPDGDGLGVLRQNSEDDGPRPDFIVITAARDVDNVRAAMQLGAVHYLVKPFGFADFRDRLESYAEMRQRLAALQGEAVQAEVDELFSLMRPSPSTIPVPNKGHSGPTLELVRNAAVAAGDVSAAEIAESVGISRATAQRYLSYLARHGLLELQLKYGATGRPEHRYRPAPKR